MRIFHKWSHTETIHQAQSQSHNLTSSHKISGSYPPSSAYPISHFYSFSCDHYWNYPPGSVPDFTSVKPIHQAQPHYHTFFSPSGTIPHTEIPDQSLFKYQFIFHSFTFQHKFTCQCSYLSSWHIHNTFLYTYHTQIINHQFTPFIYSIYIIS